MKKTAVLFVLGLLPALVTGGEKPGSGNVGKLVSRMTLEQKARLLVGALGSDEGMSHKVRGAAGYTFPIDSLGIPSINLADGPVGVRISPEQSDRFSYTIDAAGVPVKRASGDVAGSGSAPSYSSFCTCFPSTTALAATWNKGIARIEGEAIGAEAAAYGVDIVLTPGINIMRNPLCGRNFEYFSEDPYLSGKMASEMIQGIQSEGVGTSLKHFVANNQQTGKLYNDARISQRALREIYLKGFEICVKEAAPWTVMGSYNKIGATYTQPNPELLKTILRDEWGYEGLVITDWYKTRETVGQINGGTYLLMPGEKLQYEEIIAGVKDGSITMEALDGAVENVLSLIVKTLSYNGWEYKGSPDLDAHARLAREVAAEGMVLLKNDGGLLPLDGTPEVALFGATAYKSIAGGTGSSNVNKPYITDIVTGMENAGYEVNGDLKDIYTKYAAFQDALLERDPNSTAWELLSYNRVWLPEMDLRGAEKVIDRAAKECDVAVVVLGRISREESDRRLDGDFNLSAEERFMIESVSEKFHAAGKKVIVVMNVCGVMEMASWRDKADAILMAWFPGQECGTAVADVLGGKSDPSGRLPMTFPMKYEDVPSSRNYPYVGQKSGKNFDFTNYEEDIWVGYRYFDTTGKAVAYPFGFGLSYTEFTFTNPTVKYKKGKWIASVDVVNTGKYAGKEVVQMYVSAPPADVARPAAELKDFGKTRRLQPGESQTLQFEFSDYDIAYFDSAESRWVADKGVYRLSFGASSRDIKASVNFTVKKSREWKVNDVLRPVEKVNVMDIGKESGDLKYYDASGFKILGKVYSDSLPMYSRIPDFLKPSTRDAVWRLGQNSAGIAVRFRTDSPVISARWESSFFNSLPHMSPLGVRGLDLYCRTDSGWRFVGSARPSLLGRENECRIAGNMDEREREYMLYLPLYDGVDSLEIGIEPSASIGNPELQSPSESHPVVFYGTSILQGACASRPGMAGTNIIGRELDMEVINLGFSGNAFLDYETARMMADVDASVYVLDFVPNASAEMILEKTEKFVRILRDSHPEVPLVFVEDPAFPHSAFDNAIAEEIAKKNDALRTVFAGLKRGGMKNVYIVGGESLLPDSDATADGVHSTDAGFMRYADVLLPLLKKCINQNYKNI